ncbi:MAG: helix-turn-helix domain-containing protein [Micrococcales bacterium]|nr:helix-turn-helix domain-containing protein [Micrococcales bacterium]
MTPALTIADKLREARVRSSLSMNDLAKLSGVSQPTVSRVESGQSQPSAATYLALLQAAGFYDDGTQVVPVSRPSATWTARWLLGDLDDKPEDADRWVGGWQRIGLVGDDLAVLDVEGLLFRAGRSAVLTRRPGSFDVQNPQQWSAREVAARLRTAGVEHAVTGDEALEQMGAPLIPVAPVVYVSDMRAAIAALGTAPCLPADWRRRKVSLVPFDTASETGRWQADGGTWFASQVQVVLDGYGGYGRMVEQTQALVRWLEEERR